MCGYTIQPIWQYVIQDEYLLKYESNYYCNYTFLIICFIKLNVCVVVQILNS